MVINMIRPIVRDTLLLRKPSAPATRADRQTMIDLQDTLRANAEHCVGMAANMIGVHKRILVFSVGPAIITMVNPVIIRRDDPYEVSEGCLSLLGMRRTMRYQTIEVNYQDQNFAPKHQTFTGFTAQIIQHEIDHFEGILI